MNTSSPVPAHHSPQANPQANPQAAPQAASQATSQGQSQGVGLEPKSGFVESARIRDLADRMRAYLRAGIPVHLRGPAGCGKTSIAMHVAKSIQRPIAMVIGDKNLKTADLVGAKSGYQTKRVVDNFVASVSRVEENVVQGWQDHRLTVACREGHTFLYDEFNRSPAEANNIFLSVLEERVLVLPAHGGKPEEYLKVSPRFSLILTSNPTEYAGTHVVQDALADRMITIDLGHQDREAEIDITASRSGAPRALVERIVDFIRDYRASGAYDHAPTMRASIMIAKIIHAGGLDLSMDNPMLGRICLDVLEAKCGGDGNPVLKDMRRDFLTALARHHFNSGPRPVLDGAPSAPVSVSGPNSGSGSPGLPMPTDPPVSTNSSGPRDPSVPPVSPTAPPGVRSDGSQIDGSPASAPQSGPQSGLPAGPAPAMAPGPQGGFGLEAGGPAAAQAAPAPAPEIAAIRRT
ncbi:gas vesicle protein GvpN [Eilatimonas milleporae]|nr:gas vesicle protein GvpN [Eilatimonas milleporae]